MGEAEALQGMQKDVRMTDSQCENHVGICWISLQQEISNSYNEAHGHVTVPEIIASMKKAVFGSCHILFSGDSLVSLLQSASCGIGDGAGCPSVHHLWHKEGI